jgi:hypothetical protein
MLKSFTKNYDDNSSEAGFQFTFFCDLCHHAYRTTFIESVIFKKKKGSFLRSISGGARTIGNLIKGTLNNKAWRADNNTLYDRLSLMSPEWQQEHDEAFEGAQKEARQHFNRCQGCGRWVCDSDFNEDEFLCIDCAPR